MRIECFVWDLAEILVPHGDARGAAWIGGWWCLFRIVVVADGAGGEVVEGFCGVRGLGRLEIALVVGWCFL